MRSFCSRCLYLLALLIIICAACLTFLPAVLSTEWGTLFLQKTINRMIPGHVEISSVQLHWGKGQKVEGFVLTDPQGETVVRFDKFYTDGSLWQLFKKSTELGFSRIKNLEINLSTYEEGRSNLQEALNLKPSPRTANLVPTSITLSSMEGDLFLSSDPAIPLSCHLSGRTRQGAVDGSFKINLLLKGLSGENWNKLSEDVQRYFSIEGGKEAKIEAKIEQFPTEFIDQILSMSGAECPCLSLLFGDRFDLSLNKDPDIEGLSLKMIIESPFFEGTLRGKITKNVFALVEPAIMNLRLDPAQLDALLPAAIQIIQPGNLRIGIDQFQFPFEFMNDQNVVDPCSVKFKARFNFSLLDVKAYAQSLKIDKLAFLLDTASCNQKINLKASGVLAHDQKEAPFSFDTLLNTPKTIREFLAMQVTGFEGDLAISHFPIDLIPGLGNQPGWTQKIGSELYLRGTVTQKDTFMLEGNLSLNTESIELETVDYALKIIPGEFSLESITPNVIIKDLSNSNQTILSDLRFMVEENQSNWMVEADVKSNFNPYLKLIKPVSIQFNSQLDSIDFNENWLSKLQLQGQLKLDEVLLNDPGLVKMKLSQIKIPFEITAADNRFTLDLKGLAAAGESGEMHPISTHIEVKDWLRDNRIDLEQTQIEVNSKLIGAPTTILSKIVNPEFDFTPLIGPVVDVELSTLIDRKNQSNGYWDMTIDSALFHGKARLIIDKTIKLYESKNPSAMVRLTLTPDSIQLINKILAKNLFLEHLSEPITFTIWLSSLELPIAPEIVHKNPIQFSGNLTTTELKWQRSLALSPLKLEGNFETKNLLSGFDFHLNGITNQDYGFNLSASFIGLIDSNWQLKNLNDIPIKLHLNGTRFPPELFQALNLADSAQSNLFKGLFGKALDLKGDLELNQLSGSVGGLVKGEHGHALLNGKMVNGVLTLLTPFQWSLNVNRNLIDFFSAQKTPFLKEMIRSEQPIKLSIDPVGFSCPVFPIDTSRLTMDDCKIEMGKVIFKNEGSVKDLFNVISAIKEKEISIWFTPIYLHAKKGEIQFERFDFLIAHHYPLACWGKIQGGSHDLNFILGLTAPALQSAFGISGLKSDYVLQVPLKGRKGQIEIDKAKLVARISALLAKNKGSDKVKLLGSILEIAVSDKGDPRPPKPTTQPFPWDNSKSPK